MTAAPLITHRTVSKPVMNEYPLQLVQWVNCGKLTILENGWFVSHLTDGECFLCRAEV